MASEIRVNKINSRTGVGTITLSPTGVDFTGIATAATLRATTGIVTSLTAGSLTSLGAVSGTTGTFSSTTTVEGALTLVDTIVHSGDDDTKIRFPAADTVTVETGGTEALRVDSSQKLLIGTTSSQGHASGNLLEIGNYTLTNAGITINNPTNGAGLILFGDSSSTNRRGRIEYNHTADAFRFYTADAERARIDSSGNIGIGTASPNYLTTIAGNSGNAKLNLKRLNAASNGNAFGSLFYTNSDGNDVASVRAHRESAADDAYLAFATRNTGGSVTERFRITSTGQVQIPVNATGATSGRFQLGASQQLSIFQDSANAYIANDDLIISNGAVDEVLARFRNGGAVDLNHNNSTKLATKSDGVVVTGGIYLDGSGGTASANKLDDYEEGTFTAALNTVNNNATVSASNTTGYYVKVGHMVHLHYYTEATTVTSAGTSSAVLTGLPFTVATLSSGYAVATVTHTTIFTGQVQNGYAGPSQTRIVFVGEGNTSSMSYQTGSNKYLMVSLTYRAA